MIRISTWFVLQGAAVVLLLVGIGRRWFALGVPGEWEWLRIAGKPPDLGLAIGVVAVGSYGLFAVLGWRSLKHPRKSTRGGGQAREACWLIGLSLAAVPTQLLILDAAPEGYGLERWAIALNNEGSSGYATVARTQVKDLGQFLQDYPDWITRQDALHIGTHPPGLFVTAHLARSVCQARPELARAIWNLTPTSAQSAFKAMASYAPLSLADQTALALTGFVTLVACALTVIPIYLLSRVSLPAEAAWVAAVVWPLCTSALMFHPTADTAFPLLATTSLACAAGSTISRRVGWSGIALATLTGVLLAIGMQFSLVFLAIGLIVGLILASPSWSAALRVVMTGVGFLLTTAVLWWITGANLVQIWWANQHNHQRFYLEYPRSYASWLIVNPIELAIGLGLPTVMLILAARPREWTRPALATILVLVMLTLSGRSLSEVGRLWLPMMPALLPVAARGWQRLELGGAGVASTVVWLGVQVLALQSLIQVVYPVSSP